MSDLGIEHEIVVDAPIEVVWRTITEPEQIEQWFTDSAALDLRPGGTGELVWDEKASTPTAMIAEIVVDIVEPPRRFAFRWSHPTGERAVAGNSTLVDFTLTAEADQRTLVRVVETGLEEIGWSDADKARYAEEHREGWALHLGTLATFVRGGGVAAV